MSVCTIYRAWVSVCVHLGVCALQHMEPLGAAQSQGHCTAATANSVALNVSSVSLFSRLR